MSTLRHITRSVWEKGGALGQVVSAEDDQATHGLVDLERAVTLGEELGEELAGTSVSAVTG